MKFTTGSIRYSRRFNNNIVFINKKTNFSILAPKKSTARMTSEPEIIESELHSASSNPSSYKKPTSPSGAPLSKINPSLFPLSISESFKHFWSRKDILKTQEALLSTLPFYPTPSESHSSEIISFKSSNSLIFPDINEFHVKPKGTSKDEKHLVIIHGYGAGLGFFIKNIEQLTKEHPDWHIHAIDLPGYGCSTRVNFPHKIPYENYQTVEKLFTIPLRDWYLSRGLDETNSITIAHSMGGYLSLMLQINEVNGDGYLNESEFKFLKSRFGCTSKSDTAIFEKQSAELSNTATNPRRFWDTLILVSPGGIYHHRAKEIEENVPQWFTKLWNRNVSPFSLVRYSGPLGSYFVSGWTSRRFAISNLFDENLRNLLHKYSYSIFDAKGSGEYMLNYLLAPGGIPRHPLLDRVDQLGNHAGRTLWLYGGNDWMDHRGGVLASEKLNKLRSGSSQVEIVPGAGHHIYLDAFKSFNSIIGREMIRVEGGRSK